ncbi:MAG: glycine--tRNA ligase subunit beta [Myxococcota bacterium]
MSELFLEVASEELPAKEILGAVAELARFIVDRLDALRIGHGDAQTYATPRRLIVVVPDVVGRQPDKKEEVLGPPARIAMKDGVPTKAAEAFAQKLGLDVSALSLKSTPKGDYVAAMVEEKGRPTHELLPEVLETAIGKIPWKRSMRWGSLDATFARPLQWIVALYAGEVVRFGYGDVESGRTSRGHRFLAPASFEVKDAAQYLQEIAERKVVVDVDQRKAMILKGATELAESVGGELYADVGLLDEVTQLVEWPEPMLGSFEAQYLEIPQEVLISEMREHLRYFSIIDESKKLLPNFIVVANTKVEDKNVSLGGYRRVLSARFQDGRFFFTEDQKTPLWDRVEKLGTMTYQRELGSQLSKVERVVRLAFELAGKLGIHREAPADPRALAAGLKAEGFAWELARAGYLMKADLTTLMVFEFPELQGVMGRAYALKSGEPEAVAMAIEEHYWPKNAADRLSKHKRGVLGALLGLADRLDTIVGILSIGKGPTGSADPFGLRRAARGVMAIVKDQGWSLDLVGAVAAAAKAFKDPPAVETAAFTFLRTRVEEALVEDGFPREVAAAVNADESQIENPAGRSLDVVDIGHRAQGLVEARRAGSFQAVAAAAKRIRKILPKGVAFAEPAKLEAGAEQDLGNAYRGARAELDRLLQGKADATTYTQAFSLVAALGTPLDKFFEDVLVNDPNEEVAKNRKGLLFSIQTLLARLANFDRLGTD